MARSRRGLWRGGSGLPLPLLPALVQLLCADLYALEVP